MTESNKQQPIFSDKYEINSITDVEQIIADVMTERDGSRFYGIFLANMYKEIDHHLEAPMAVCRYKNSYKVMLNPILLKDYSKFKIRAILIHECLHIIHLHLKRFPVPDTKDMTAEAYQEAVRHHKMVNIACDLSINQLITHLKNDKECINMPWFKKTISKFLGDIDVEEKRESEYYLDILEKCEAQSKKNDEQNKKNGESNQNQSNGSQGQNNNGGQGSGETSNDGEGQSNGGQNTDENDGESNQNQGDDGNGLDSFDKALSVPKIVDVHNWENDDEDEESAKNLVSHMIRKAMKGAGAGNTPADVERIYNEYIESKIYWKRELRSFCTRSIKFDRVSTRKRLHRVHKELVAGKRKRYKAKIAVVVDTSGSIGGMEFEAFYSEIKAMYDLNLFEIYVCCVDAEVHSWNEFSKQKEIKFVGGGGTAYQPGLDKCVEEKVDNIVYFGDMYNWEPELKNPKIPVLWVSTTKTKLKPDKCDFGKSIFLDIEQ